MDFDLSDDSNADFLFPKKKKKSANTFYFRLSMH